MAETAEKTSEKKAEEKKGKSYVCKVKCYALGHIWNPGDVIENASLDNNKNFEAK